MTPPRPVRPRSTRVRSADDDAHDALALDVEAREAGMRSYRHWQDRNEPPATLSAVAMRQACPYLKGDPRIPVFFEGWQNAAGTLWDHIWCGSKYPERKGNECRVLKREANRLEIEFRDGERVRTTTLWVRRKVA